MNIVANKCYVFGGGDNDEYYNDLQVLDTSEFFKHFIVKYSTNTKQTWNGFKHM